MPKVLVTQTVYARGPRFLSPSQMVGELRQDNLYRGLLHSKIVDLVVQLADPGEVRFITRPSRLPLIVLLAHECRGIWSAPVLLTPGYGFMH